MIDKYSRDWDGNEWEQFSLRLIRERHGPENVQPIPANVKGDLGLECITTCGCVYQSYAPQETSDTHKAASAMKAKAGRDLGKLEKYKTEIEKLLGGKKIRRWILICPFLDDKDVVRFVAQKAEKTRTKNLNFLCDDFRGLVHCQADFGIEIERIRLSATSATVKLINPDATAIEEAGNNISEILIEKLERGFPESNPETRLKKQNGFIRTHIRAENAMEKLQRDAPELWDRLTMAIALEEERLTLAGSTGVSTSGILTSEQDRLATALAVALPTLDANVINAIAIGQIGTWLIECPLDFVSPKEAHSDG